MKNRVTNLMSRAAHVELASAGAANGIGNRARTMRSKREKANCPKRQRRQWRSGLGE